MRELVQASDISYHVSILDLPPTHWIDWSEFRQEKVRAKTIFLTTIAGAIVITLAEFTLATSSEHFPNRGTVTVLYEEAKAGRLDFLTGVQAGVVSHVPALIRLVLTLHAQRLAGVIATIYGEPRCFLVSC